jgi:hypothetical protein
VFKRDSMIQKIFLSFTASLTNARNRPWRRPGSECSPFDWYPWLLFFRLILKRSNRTARIASRKLFPANQEQAGIDPSSRRATRQPHPPGPCPRARTSETSFSSARDSGLPKFSHGGR